jgi:hypothetical protein
MCYCTVKVASYFDKSVGIILPLWEKTLYLDNTKSKQVLKIDYKEANQAILAMAESLYSSGQVVRK